MVGVTLRAWREGRIPAPINKSLYVHCTTRLEKIHRLVGWRGRTGDAAVAPERVVVAVALVLCSAEAAAVCTAPAA